MNNILFYTSESSQNALFQYCLWFQPSLWRMLFQESTKTLTITVFLDSRYVWIAPQVSQNELEKRFKKSVDLTIKERSKAIREYLTPLSLETISFETSLPFWIVTALQEHLPLQPLHDSYQQPIRAIKTIQEQTAHTEAIAKTHQLRERLEDQLPTFLWTSELTVRWALIDQAMQLWLTGEAFDTIVATGKNSAIPHHTTSQDIITPWPLLIDMWRKRNWYCSDMTRCFWLWEKTGEYDLWLKTLHHVQEAHKHWCSLAVAWTSTKLICEQVREYLQRHGLEQYFTHALGHGVWIDVHEYPWVSARSDIVLETWMVMTIEPGVYFPGQFGIRWEDTLIVAKE